MRKHGWILAEEEMKKKNLRAATETGNDVIAQVKKNQKTLPDDCGNIPNTIVSDDIFTEPFEKRRNRIMIWL